MFEKMLGEYSTVTPRNLCKIRVLPSLPETPYVSCGHLGGHR